MVVPNIDIGEQICGKRPGLGLESEHQHNSY